MGGRVLAVLLVVCAACVPYVPSLDNYFVQDDFGVVALLAQKPATYFPRWFVTPWMDDIWGYVPDEIRPFPAATYQLSALWGAASPVANHVINVALHALNAVLVLIVTQRSAGLSLVPSAFAAVVFAVLPMQTESVAWITGRVDSMPACLYLASFLMFVEWRALARRRAYWWAVGFCFGALFSKQNTVTLVPALVLYDVVIGGRRPHASWAWVRPYAPFAALTVGYLALRYALFGEVARESMLTWEHLRVFAIDLGVHLKRMVYGELGVAMSGPRLATIVGLAAAAAVLHGVLVLGRSALSLGAVALYFGLGWIALCIAPTMVAGYASPRHMYLASVGWAVLVAVPLELVWRQRHWLWMRGAAVVVAAALCGAYVVQLHRDVTLWDTRSTVSRLAVEDVEREVREAPPGTLVMIGAPRRSFDFAIPHAFRPPYTVEDLPARVRFISHSSLHCCPANIWEPYTRGTLRAWIEDPTQPPVIALHWHPDTGALSRVDDAAEPFLRSLVPVLLETRTVAALDSALLDVLNKLVAGRVVRAND